MSAALDATSAPRLPRGVTSWLAEGVAGEARTSRLLNGCVVVAGYGLISTAFRRGR